MVLLFLGIGFQSCEREEELNVTSDSSNDFRIEAFSKALSQVMSDERVKKDLKTEALKQFDGDYNVLVHQYFETENGSYLKGKLRDAGFNDFSELEKNFELLNIAVPVHIEEWNTEDFTPSVIYLPYNYDEQTTLEVDGFSADGKFIKVSALEEPDIPFVVVRAANERLVRKADIERMNELVSIDDFTKYWKDYYLENKYIDDVQSSNELELRSCNNHNRYITLYGIHIHNLGSFESWIAGAPEIRINVLAGYHQNNFGVRVYNSLEEPRKRRDINCRWWYREFDLFRWNFSRDGEYVTIEMDEEDGGIWETDQKLIEVKWNDKTYSVTAPKFLRDKRTHMLTRRIVINECFPRTYSSNVSIKLKN